VKALGSSLLGIIVFVVAVWLVFKLLVGALKLVGLLVVVALAVGAYFVVKGMIEGPGDA
jgi:hypothetical protein